MRRLFVVLTALGFLIGGLLPATSALDQVELCLALDGSSSIDPADFTLQLEGVAQALQSPSIVPTDGTVTISVVQFSTDVTVHVPPRVIDSAATVNAIAATVRSIVQKRNATNTAEAIDVCTRAGFTFQTSRQVIDISTDGLPSVTTQNPGQIDQPAARQAALDAANAAMANGIDAINALGVGGVDEVFLRELVRPQPASNPPDDGFVILVDTFQEYIDAMKDKIKIEVQPEAECCVCECLFGDTFPSLWALELDLDFDGIFERSALFGVFWFDQDFTQQEAQNEAEALLSLANRLVLNLIPSNYRLTPWYLPDSPAWVGQDLELLVKWLTTQYKGWDFDDFVLVDIWKRNWRHLCGTHIRADVIVDCNSGQLVDPSLPRQVNTTELCLALDGSSSIDPPDFTLQLEGVAQAIENAGIVPRDGSVSMSVVQFSTDVTVHVPPRVIDSAATVNAIAATVRSIVQKRNATNTAEAIDVCTRAGFTFQTSRQVIDISTDGLPSVTTQNPGQIDEPAARQAALDAANAAMASGVDAINALGVGGVDQTFLESLVRPQPASVPPDDGFVILVNTFDEYIDAMQNKIRIEVAPPSEPCECLEYVGSVEFPYDYKNDNVSALWTLSFMQNVLGTVETSLQGIIPNIIIN